jgi:hypothetical protein
MIFQNEEVIMPTQREIKVMAKKRGLSIEEMSKQVFGHMRAGGWRPKAQGGPTKRWKAHKG